MVRGDCSDDIFVALADCVDCGGGGAVFEDDFEGGEFAV